MRQPYFSNTRSRIVFVLDIATVLVSLAISVLLRAQFDYYLLGLTQIAALVPIALILRVIVLFVLDHYAIGFAILAVSDIRRLLLHNLIPTAILIVMRLASPSPLLVMPFSIIMTEYVLSSMGMLLVRLTVHRFRPPRGTRVGYRQRILVWAHPRLLAAHINALLRLSSEGSIEIVGGLTADPVFWHTEHFGVRIFGDERCLKALLASDDRISTIMVMNPENLTYRRLTAMCREMTELRLRPAVYMNGQVQHISMSELAQRGDYFICSGGDT